jgi:hypothetical protein
VPDPKPQGDKLAVGLLNTGDVFVEYASDGRYFMLTPQQALDLGAALIEAARLSPHCPGKQ